MSKIVVNNEMSKVDNNGCTVIYDYGMDVVILPALVSTKDGDHTIEQCDAVIADGRAFLASCTALYGCFSVKVMEE